MQYKRDLVVYIGPGRKIRIAVSERPLLNVTVTCPKCGKKSKWSLFDIFLTTGIKGRMVDFWYYICGSCGSDIARASYEAARAQFAVLEKNYPDLAHRLTICCRDEDLKSG